MHQHARIGNIIGMEISNLKVINDNRLIQLLTVNFGNGGSSAVSKIEDVALTLPILSYSVVNGILRTYAIHSLYKSECQKTRSTINFVTLPELLYSYL